MSPIPETSNITVLIDNYDSFTWNVYQYLSELGAEVQVFRNDKTTLEHITSLDPKNIIISPGPGRPSTDSGISNDVIVHFAGKIPIFGVCLGEQCIFEVYGGKVGYAGEIVHGKVSKILHDGKGCYLNVPKDIIATRYHSLSGQPQTVPEELEVTSWSESGVVMGIRHREFTIEGVQYHPESILSEHGKIILSNFLKLKGGKWNDNPEFDVKQPLAKTSVPSKSVPTILEKIHKQRLADIELAKNQPGSSYRDLKELLSLHVAPPLIDFVARIKQTLPKYPAIFAEIKRASPSKGNIDLSVNAVKQALTYSNAGASVISVLTETKWFKGTLNDMRQVRDALSTIPNRPAVLRKDFIVDTYQIMEARLFGADTILLIVSILSDEKLTELYNFSKNLGMEPLVEVNNEEEMLKALKLGAKVIGVNNRNLHTFDVDMNTTSRLAEMVPEDVILAALSGITGRADVISYLDQGVKALLIGEALMKSENKQDFIKELLELNEEEKVDDENSVLLKIDTPRSPLVKICGILSIEAAIAAADAGTDFIGLIFAKAKRQVKLETALEIVNVIREMQLEKKIELNGIKDEESTPYGILTSQKYHDWFQLNATRISHARKPLIVGVFRNQSLDYITKVVYTLKLDLVQLHGDEPLDLARFIPVPVIKAFPIDENFSNPTLVTQPGYNELCLLDSKVTDNKISGKGGQKFDWDIALKIKKSVSNKLIGKESFPIILAGGLTLENVEEAVRKVKPWIVDVSSGVETNNEKDLDKIREFITRAKSVVYDEDDEIDGELESNNNIIENGDKEKSSESQEDDYQEEETGIAQ
ncbi:N-anthranilate isomerase [Glomus cerebriforme]|uniref:Multifunctional tryptophan biosynthesis protein n=1 Tax=Glomus cerebriforme TaxID=658196 RepID=A0A397T805_9GLOM|nr:N-anthranilate isomerase [Glomus cerebriforme]